MSEILILGIESREKKFLAFIILIDEGRWLVLANTANDFKNLPSGYLLRHLVLLQIFSSISDTFEKSVILFYTLYTDRF